MKIFHTIALAPVILCCLLLTGCWINISPADPSGEPGPPVLISSRALYRTVPVVVQLKDVQSLVNTQVPTHVEGTTTSQLPPDIVLFIGTDSIQL